MGEVGRYHGKNNGSTGHVMRGVALGWCAMLLLLAAAPAAQAQRSRAPGAMVVFLEGSAHRVHAGKKITLKKGDTLPAGVIVTLGRGAKITLLCSDRILRKRGKGRVTVCKAPRKKSLWVRLAQYFNRARRLREVGGGIRSDKDNPQFVDLIHPTCTLRSFPVELRWGAVAKCRAYEVVLVDLGTGKIVFKKTVKTTRLKLEEGGKVQAGKPLLWRVRPVLAGRSLYPSWGVRFRVLAPAERKQLKADLSGIRDGQGEEGRLRGALIRTAVYEHRNLLAAASRELESVQSLKLAKEFGVSEMLRQLRRRMGRE